MVDVCAYQWEFLVIFVKIFQDYCQTNKITAMFIPGAMSIQGSKEFSLEDIIFEASKKHFFPFLLCQGFSVKYRGLFLLVTSPALGSDDLTLDQSWWVFKFCRSLNWSRDAFFTKLRHYMKFCIRNNVSKLEFLMPQDFYYLLLCRTSADYSYVLAVFPGYLLLWQQIFLTLCFDKIFSQKIGS